jgi:hypothetical protein
MVKLDVVIAVSGAMEARQGDLANIPHLAAQKADGLFDAAETSG